MKTAPINASFCQTFRFFIDPAFFVLILAGLGRSIRFRDQIDGAAHDGVATKAGDQVGFGRQLDQIVVRARGPRSSADVRAVVRGEDDDRSFGGGWIRSKEPDQRQTVDVREHEILKDDRRADLVRPLDGVGRARAAVKIDVLRSREQAAHRDGDKPLVVDQEDRDPLGLSAQLRWVTFVVFHVCREAHGQVQEG